MSRHKRTSDSAESQSEPLSKVPPLQASPEAGGERIRFDPTPGLGSWRVQMLCRGRLHLKRFPVLRHDSSEAALQAATAWRDELRQKLTPYTQQERVQFHRSNNTSGAPGVYRMKATRIRSNGTEAEYIHWEARTPEGVKPAKKKAFSVRRYGEEGAYEMNRPAFRGGPLV